MERLLYPNNPSNSYPLHENPSSSHLLTFPSPLLNDEDLFASLLHYKPLPTIATTTTTTFCSGDNKPPMDGHGRRTEIEEGESTLTESKSKPQVAPTKRKRGGVKKQPAKRRAGKKDRHSKIYTAQGCRDRRMRLSLQIARKFFDLQDMLGFDKASKTIEWLFSNSMSAIRDLTASLPPHLRKGDLSTVNADMSSTSVSQESTEVYKGNLDVQKDELKLMNDKKSPHLSSLARESREKARARARQRTMEKKQKGLMLEKSPSHEKCNDGSSSKLGSSSTTETVDQVESGCGAYSAIENQISCVGFIEKLLGSDHSSAARSSINDDPNYMGLPSNWVADTMKTSTIYGAVTDVDELKVILQHQNPSRSASVPGNSAFF